MAGLKEIVSTWYEASQLADKNRLQEAASKLQLIPDPSAKILFNLGCLYLRMKDYPQALKYLDEATAKDCYLAVAYFQRGITNSLLEKAEEAASDFTQALTVMKENKVIDYRQLGMSLTLYSFQAVYNMAVMKSRAGNQAQAQAFMSRAARLHDEARMLPGFQGQTTLNQNGRWMPLELPHLECFFHPAKSMVANLEKRDFLGKAKVVSSVNESEEYLTPVPLVEKPVSRSTPTSPAMSRREPEPKKKIPPPPSRAPPICPVIRTPPPSRSDDTSQSALPLPGSLNHSASAENVSVVSARLSPKTVRKTTSQDSVVAKLNSLFKDGGRVGAKPKSEFFISPPLHPRPPVSATSTSAQNVYVNEGIKAKPARPPPPVIKKS